MQINICLLNQNLKNYIRIIFFKLILFGSRFCMNQTQKKAIRKYYKSKDIAEFVLHQIQSIEQSYSLYVQYDQINIHVPIQINQNHPQLILQTEKAWQRMEYLIIIGKGYPVTPPKIYIRSAFDQFPSINDCRDIFKQVIKDWTYITDLNAIIGLLKTFSTKVKNTNCPLKRQKLGQFVLGTRFKRDFLESIGCTLFQAFQNTQVTLNFYMICVTDTHFLIFRSQLQPFVDKSAEKVKIPSLKSIDTIWLCFVSDIQAISELKISNENYLESIFTFNSVKVQKMKIFTIKTEKRMKIDNFETLASKIFERIGKFQKVNMKLETSVSNKQEQRQIMKEIMNKQQKISQNQCKENIKQLQQAYQKAIQYYSKASIPYQKIFVNRIVSLYSRQEVWQTLSK